MLRSALFRASRRTFAVKPTVEKAVDTTAHDFHVPDVVSAAYVRLFKNEVEKLHSIKDVPLAAGGASGLEGLGEQIEGAMEGQKPSVSGASVTLGKSGLI